MKDVRVFKLFVSCFYIFTDKTITLQQYNPNNTGQSFPAYDVRVVIEEDNGIITFANLSGSYNSEEPYAWFKVGFSRGLEMSSFGIHTTQALGRNN